MCDRLLTYLPGCIASFQLGAHSSCAARELRYPPFACHALGHAEDRDPPILRPASGTACSPWWCVFGLVCGWCVQKVVRPLRKEPDGSGPDYLFMYHDVLAAGRVTHVSPPVSTLRSCCTYTSGPVAAAMGQDSGMYRLPYCVPSVSVHVPSVVSLGRWT